MLLPFLHAGKIEAGCDEAGRGCLAGPVFAAAVILPPDFRHPLLRDSKQLSEKQREILRPIIKREAVAFCVATASAEEIDQINILQASLLAMRRAIAGLQTRPGQLLIDGYRFTPFENIPFDCIVRGDGIYQSIAAASILAKTVRDDYMERLSKEFPAYGWARNKGYPTIAHRAAIRDFGLTVHHRQTFRWQGKLA